MSRVTDIITTFLKEGIDSGLKMRPTGIFSLTRVLVREIFTVPMSVAGLIDLYALY